MKKCCLKIKNLLNIINLIRMFRYIFDKIKIFIKNICNGNEGAEKIEINSEKKELSLKQRIIEEQKKNSFWALFLLIFPVLIFVFQIYNTVEPIVEEKGLLVLLNLFGAIGTIVFLMLALNVIYNQQINLKEILLRIENYAQNIMLRNYDHFDDISLIISNMYNFILHVPIYFGKVYGYFKNESLDIIFHNAHSDLNALRNISDGSGIAVTDPFFINELEEEYRRDIVILAPLLIKPGLWILSRKSKKAPKKIFLYDAQSSPMFLAKEYFNNEKIDFNIDENNISNLKKFHEKFFNEDYDEIDQNSMNNYIFFLKKIFCSKPGNKKSIKKFLNEHRYLILSEPEATYIYNDQTNDGYNNGKRIWNEPKALIPGSKKYIFTAVITTRKFIRNNPIIVLKFLKSLKTSFLKIHQVLQSKNNGKYNNDDINKLLDITIEGKDPSLRTKIENHLSKNNSYIFNNNIYPDDLYLFYINEDASISNYSWLKDTLNIYDNNRNHEYKKYLIDLRSKNIDYRLLTSFNYILRRLNGIKIL